MGENPQVPQARRARMRDTVLRHFWFKAFGTMGFTFVFFVAYIYLLKNPAGPVTIVPTIWLDEWIGFHPLALIPYLSLWLYVSLPPIFMHSRGEIIAYGLRIGLLCVTGLAVFYFWPSAVPPAHVDWARYPGMAFLKGVDAAGNAFPSLHVATAVFSGIWLHRLLRGFDVARGVLWANIVWCLAIVWSTVATHQHVVLDTLGGTLLALVMAWISLLPGRPVRQSGNEKKTQGPST